MMRTSIAARIRYALIGLALGLSVLFAALTLLLLYVTEDEVFVNQLVEERLALEQASDPDLAAWRPGNRHMQLFAARDQLPDALRDAVGDAPGIYEQFDSEDAYFILSGRLPSSGKSYFLVYDVSSLLAVRTGRPNFLLAIGLGALLVTLVAIAVAVYLARATLRPLRRLSAGLEHGDELPEGFAAQFSGDEIGVLAAELESALARVRAAAQREFEFNRGVSHELRSPLQVASNSLELLAMDRQADTTPLARLTRAVEEMQRISEAFLWLASDRDFDGAGVDGAAAARALVGEMRERWPQRDVLLTTPDEGVRYAMPDGVFAVVLGNLLRNAVQHSDAGDVHCELSARRIVVTNDAADGGDTAAGFGVGLEIVARVCARFGWSYRLEPRAEGGMRAVLDVDAAQMHVPLPTG